MPRIEGHTDDAPAPAAAYSQSVRIGPVVAASGQIGSMPDTGQLVSDDIGDQTRQALANVLAVLRASSASLDDVIKVNVYLATLEDFAAMNEVYREIVAEPRPARTTVAVGLLPGVKIEIDALAVLE